MDSILDWPWKRFEVMYEAFMKRSLLDSLDRRKDAMIAALWANSGFEGNEGAKNRSQIIEDIETQYDEAVRKIQIGIPEEEQEEKIAEDNPFFRPVKRAMAKLETPRNDEGTVREVVDYTKDIDQ